ncbi:MAG: carboxypeptidase regulatory-like domain-containing protein [Bacteroidia bacterium]
MKKKLLLFLSFQLLSVLLFAQLTQTIRGKVLDKDTQKPLEGASVVVLQTEPAQGTYTDNDGIFRIEKVAVGRQNLQISYYGYEDAVLSDIVVGSAKEVILTVELREKIQTTEAVVIKATSTDKAKAINELATVSARTFTIEEANRYAGGFSDPARMASSFAGVTANNSASNQITIRGNSPQGLLWRLEGIEIPPPSHLSNYAVNGGAVSILSANLVSNSDFFTGAFPAEYGNAASGVFDIRIRKGNNEKYEYAFQGSFLGLEGVAEGPVPIMYRKKRVETGSFLVNYRYSTTTFFGLLGFLDPREGLPSFQDISFNLHLPSQKAGNFQIFGIGGLSSIVQKPPTDTTDWREQKEKEMYNFYSNMGVLGVSHQIFLGKNKNTYLKSIASFTIRGVGHRADEYDDNLKKTNNGSSANNENNAILSSLVNHKFNARTTLRAGLILTQRNYSLLFKERMFGDTMPTPKTFLEDKGGMFYTQAYFQGKYRWTENLELTAGIHSLYLPFNQDVRIEPRAGLRWSFLPKQSLSVGLGLHSRLLPTAIYFETIDNEQPNKKIKLAQAQHYVVGYDFQFAQDWRLKLEVYYQHLRKVPIGSADSSTFSILNNTEPIISTFLINKGIGRNYGIEGTIEKFFTHHYYALLTFSIFDSKYKTLTETWYNTRYNGRYSMNVLGGKEFNLSKKKNRWLEISGRIVLAGGNRETPIDKTASDLYQYAVYQTDKPFSSQLPIYFRPDFKISYKSNRPKTRQIISLEIQNLAGYWHTNVIGTYYDAAAKSIRENRDLSFLPNFLYRIEF